MADDLTRSDALGHYFYTLGLRGHQIVDAKGERWDWAKIYLMEVAGMGTQDPMDKIYAEILLFAPDTQMDFEQARIRNTRPLPQMDRN
jgi:hypothetical protein